MGPPFWDVPHPSYSIYGINGQIFLLGHTFFPHVIGLVPFSKQNWINYF